jgi:hypothetical protein
VAPYGPLLTQKRGKCTDNTVRGLRGLETLHLLSFGPPTLSHVPARLPASSARVSSQKTSRTRKPVFIHSFKTHSTLCTGTRAQLVSLMHMDCRQSRHDASCIMLLPKPRLVAKMPRAKWSWSWSWSWIVGPHETQATSSAPRPPHARAHLTAAAWWPAGLVLQRTGTASSARHPSNPCTAHEVLAACQGATAGRTRPATEPSGSEVPQQVRCGRAAATHNDQHIGRRGPVTS